MWAGRGVIWATFAQTRGMIRSEYQVTDYAEPCMNGYEKHSSDYGGPPVRWAAIVLSVALLVGFVLALVWLGTRS